MRVSLQTFMLHSICNMCKQAFVPMLCKACTVMNGLRRDMCKTISSIYLAVAHIWDASQELFRCFNAGLPAGCSANAQDLHTYGVCMSAGCQP